MLNLFSILSGKNVKNSVSDGGVKCCIHINGEALFFKFHSKTAVRTEFPDKGLDGYKYKLNNRLYTDEKSFSNTKDEKLSDEVSINLDIYGQKVLYLYTSVPTFDFGDREWDSAINEYLMFDGRDINLIQCRRGYKIASITIYKKLISASENTRPWLERLEFPGDGITFTDTL